MKHRRANGGTLPAVVIHGGAGRFRRAGASADRARESLRRIAEEAWKRLRRESALACVTWAVTQLEDDPQFNAGTGGKLQCDGIARLSAGVMDGSLLRFAGIVNLERTRNPILVARKLMGEKDRVLDGAGAERFARRIGFRSYNPTTEEAWSEWRRKSRRGPSIVRSAFGTVGAVAVDMHGRLAAATSTGGKGMEIAGRVSDVNTVAGTYASSKAAVSATGVGEEIVEGALAVRIVTRVDDGWSLEEAFAKTFSDFRKMKGRAGAIGVDVRGKIKVLTTTPSILYAARSPKVSAGFP